VHGEDETDLGAGGVEEDLMRTFAAVGGEAVMGKQGKNFVGCPACIGGKAGEFFEKLFAGAHELILTH